MSLVTTLEAMTAAGCTPEQMLAVVRAHVAEKEAQGPRAISPSLRAAVLQRDGYKCSYCGAENVPLYCDHIQPYSRGGATSFDNLTAACKPCNSSKKDRDIGVWRA